jgi:ABC-type transporter MlaC component
MGEKDWDVCINKAEVDPRKIVRSISRQDFVERIDFKRLEPDHMHLMLKLKSSFTPEQKENFRKLINRSVERFKLHA